MENLKRELSIIIAAGGTGGHLFPAQALALEIFQKYPNVRITFIGAGLESNGYFKKDLFPFLDIKSGTPIKKNPIKILKALFAIGRGLGRCMRYFHKAPPDLVVGFGSFHTFPALLAAKLKRVPILIFESNALPGRVNRFCSHWAKVSAIQFSHASDYLKGKSVCVQMPLLKHDEKISKDKARDYFQLDRKTLTLLIFGGSQGAQAINRFFCGAIEPLLKQGIVFQVIHIVGNDERAEKLRSFYKKHGVRASVKAFEEKMEYAWKAADLSVCRAGSATIAELIEFAVPSILIPYPYGTENHQGKNAAYLADEIQGGVAFSEKTFNAQLLATAIQDLLLGEQLALMKKSLLEFKKVQSKQDLCSLVFETI